jgi:hypothetical protein
MALLENALITKGVGKNRNDMTYDRSSQKKTCKLSH